MNASVAAEIGCDIVFTFAFVTILMPDFVSGIGNPFVYKWFGAVSNYSSFGRTYVVQDFAILSSDDFLRTVIDPLGISCPAGGTTNNSCFEEKNV